MKCPFRIARVIFPSRKLPKVLGQFLRTGTTKTRVLKAPNFGFDLLSSNLVLKMRYKTLGEVQRGFYNDLQTGSEAQETEICQNGTGKNRGYPELCIRK
jgi:hypothetical protein